MEEKFSKKRPEYPWQIRLGPLSPNVEKTEAACRADEARFHFEFWKTLLDENLFDHPELFYDEVPGFFRFSDGTFALSRERANWPALKEKGFFREWGM